MTTRTGLLLVDVAPGFDALTTGSNRFRGHTERTRRHDFCDASGFNRVLDDGEGAGQHQHHESGEECDQSGPLFAQDWSFLGHIEEFEMNLPQGDPKRMQPVLHHIGHGLGAAQEVLKLLRLFGQDVL